MHIKAIYRRIAAIVADTLSIEEERIKPASKLQADLGAESIDVIDLMFRLETEFGINIPEWEIHPTALCQQHPEYLCNGLVTERGLAALRERLPFIDFGEFAQDPRKSAIDDLFTVQAVTRYVEGKLSANPTNKETLVLESSR